MTANKTRQFLGAVCMLALIQLWTASSPGSTGFAQSAKDSFPKELDDYLAAAVKDFEIPGLAVAIVKDGKLIVAKGYGVRQLGKPELVDEHTIFDVASLTKSFTAAAVASLVDEKKITWDTPIKQYLPSLEFPDPYLTANVTFRDLLSHRTGLHATNGAWYFTGVSRQQLLGLIKNLRVVAPFRTQFVYSNIGYTVAGEASANAAGTTWEDLITKRFIMPLGMNRTSALYKSRLTADNVASGHALIAGVQRATPNEGAQADVTGPAGAVQSSVTDLATWMIFQLGDGSFQGKRILSSEVMSDMHSPQIIIQGFPAFRTARQIKYFGGYGLGWQVMDYRGNKTSWHSGSGDGHLALMQLLPDSRLGICILINSWKAGGSLNSALASRIMDHYLGLPTRDYAAEYREPWSRSLQQQVEAVRQFEASQIKSTKPSLPLTQYTGVFRDQFGLELKIWLEADRLRLQYGGGEMADVTHWHYDTFRVRWVNPLHAEQRSTFAQFVMSPQVKISEVQMDVSGERIIARR